MKEIPMTENKTHLRAVDFGLPVYFDLQAKMGHTKHLGGVDATRRLAELCHIGSGITILSVGVGSGISAGFVVEEYDCNVVGIDVLPDMVQSAEKWAKEKRLEDRMDFRIGDAQEIPFEDNQFDAVICESVNVFVPDKQKAIREYVRVVKPGGYVGLNEAIWVNTPSDSVEKIIIEATGQQFQPPEVWEALLEGSGLVDLVTEKHQLSVRSEARNQAGLLSIRSYLRIFVRAIWLLTSDREFRTLYKHIRSDPRQYFHYMGYGLYVGRKPESS
jgi:ubiquinone/menaquinone biosynthesis C-methylase UbiE